MSASAYVGRIGALAAAFGVGAAIFTGPAIAWADTAASDSAGSSAAGSSATGSQSPSETGSSTSVSRGHSARSGARAAASSPTTSQSSTDSGAPDVAGTVQRRSTPLRTSDSAASTSQQPAESSPSPAAATAAKTPNRSPAVTAAAVDATPTAPTASPAAAAPIATLATPAPAATQTLTQTLTSLVETVKTAVTPKLTVTPNAVTSSPVFATALANVANNISTVFDSVVAKLVSTFSGNSPSAPQVNSPAGWLLLAATRRQLLPAAATSAVAGTKTTPTLVLNGYNVVGNSTETVSAFTGRWAYFPGMPNEIQGSQGFDLVDPTTGAKVGSFTALVTSGDPTSLGSKYVQMVVTANDGSNVGTGAGQTPPVGSVLASFSLGLIGWSYSSMPTPTGDKVTTKLTTPLGNIPLPLPYDATKGLSLDNAPIDVTGGFHISPVDPTAGKLTGTIGLLPLFNSTQGTQVYGVFDTAGNQVGSFNGTTTKTSDTLGISTQEILVTANDGTNVGTNPGQTPPVGTVYNVAYFGSSKLWLLYSSKPAAGGDVISIKLGTPNGVVTTIPSSVFKNFDASQEPTMKSMTAPGGQKFVATSSEIPVGLNGLPPRDMQLQGYQQFKVVDFLGRTIGTVDADVESQWDSFGIHAKSILITNVTSGTPGTTPLNVPPVGTVMNFIDFGSGFGVVDSVIPGKTTNVNSFAFVTPLGITPLLPSLSLATHPAVDYVDPYVI